MSDLTQQILRLAQKGPASLPESERSALVQASTKLRDVLENPMEKNLRLVTCIFDPIALRVAIDLNLGDIVLAHGKPITLDELAQKTKADPYLLQRVIRLLVPLNIFGETSPGTYAATPLTSFVASNAPSTASITHMVHIYRTIAMIPDYLAANNYQNPVSAYDGPFNFAHDWYKGNYFDFMALPGNERLSAAFNRAMQMQKGLEDLAFQSQYPAHERLVNSDPERILFVDVGGGLGHQVAKFGERFASLKGKLVLEDLPQVLADNDTLPKHIAKVPHDFFKPQPESVRGAKAYYLRMILHDWPDMQSRTILENIIKVMADDSVILIHEAVLPEMGVQSVEAKLDWLMFCLGALERTEKQWAELADSVGLKVNGIWLDDGEFIGRRGILELGKK